MHGIVPAPLYAQHLYFIPFYFCFNGRVKQTKLAKCASGVIQSWPRDVFYLCRCQHNTFSNPLRICPAAPQWTSERVPDAADTTTPSSHTASNDTKRTNFMIWKKQQKRKYAVSHFFFLYKNPTVAWSAFVTYLEQHSGFLLTGVEASI